MGRISYLTVVTFDDDTTRLNLLNERLTALVSESQRLRQRWTSAAIDARTWPDMNLATERLVSLQRERKPDHDS